jgi:hypothetical protein
MERVRLFWVDVHDEDGTSLADGALWGGQRGLLCVAAASAQKNPSRAASSSAN